MPRFTSTPGSGFCLTAKPLPEISILSPMAFNISLLSFIVLPLKSGTVTGSLLVFESDTFIITVVPFETSAPGAGV